MPLADTGAAGVLSGASFPSRKDCARPERSVAVAFVFVREGAFVAADSGNGELTA